MSISNNSNRLKCFLRIIPLFCLAVIAGCGTQSSDNAAKKQDEETTLANATLPGRKGAELTIGRPPEGYKTAEAEDAHWRAQYAKNRTVPPKQFSVKPKKPRNNNFGEFEEELYTDLDQQPNLPAMPGDGIMTMMGPDAAAVSMQDFFPNSKPRAGAIHSYPPYTSKLPTQETNIVKAPKSSMNSATAQSLGFADAGLMTESRFYPIEQLVFGGEFPDLDSPEQYRLMPKDVINVTVKEHPEFSGKLEIQPDGTVRVPNLPELIRLRGLSIDEAAEELRRNLQVYIKGECIVQVQANRARGGYYFVFGDVMQPGRFPMGLEPVKLSDAVLAANWELNPARNDDEELGPAFPAANPRGKFTSPQTADLANVMLVTPHRSQPVRTSHDVRQAMLGIMREDPIVRPGQIIIVPSLDPRKNRSLGLDMPEGEPVAMPGNRRPGFSGSDAPARLPDIGVELDDYGYATQGAGSDALYAAAQRRGNDGEPELSSGMMDCLTPVQRNMAKAFNVQQNTRPIEQSDIFNDPFYSDDCVDAYPPISISVPMSQTEDDDYNAMAPAANQSGSVPATAVAGVERDEVEEQPVVTQKRGRRLFRSTASDAPATEKKAKGKKDPSKWNMGF